VRNGNKVSRLSLRNPPSRVGLQLKHLLGVQLGHNLETPHRYTISSHPPRTSIPQGESTEHLSNKYIRNHLHLIDKSNP
jgi:hypothetical protein